MQYYYYYNYYYIHLHRGMAALALEIQDFMSDDFCTFYIIMQMATRILARYGKNSPNPKETFSITTVLCVK